MLSKEETQVVNVVHDALRVIADHIPSEGPVADVLTRYMSTYTFSPEQFGMNCELAGILQEVVSE